MVPSDHTMSAFPVVSSHAPSKFCTWNVEAVAVMLVVDVHDVPFHIPAKMSEFASDAIIRISSERVPLSMSPRAISRTHRMAPLPPVSIVLGVVLVAGDQLVPFHVR